MYGSPSVANYGGRGIEVCQRWRDSFWNYVEDVGENTTGKWMDRIDNDGDYEPSNFRWVNASESNKNRRPSATDNRDRDSKGRYIS